MLEIKPFILALNQTFEEMAEIKLSNEPVETLGKRSIVADFSSSIGVFSDQENLSLILTSDTSSALKIVRRVTESPDLKKNDKLVIDTIGELLNMIVGNVQRRSKDKFHFSIPISVTGEEHEVCKPNGNYKFSRSKFYENEEKLEVNIYLLRHGA